MRAWRETVAAEVAVLAIGAAVGLTTIDLVCTFRGVIQSIYLLDAALEVPLIVAWCVAAARISAKSELPAR